VNPGDGEKALQEMIDGGALPSNYVAVATGR
jgi:hypothetical protein